MTLSIVYNENCDIYFSKIFFISLFTYLNIDPNVEFIRLFFDNTIVIITNLN